jgi:ribosomal-protein-alanine N-acetyltransferase
VLTFPNVVRLKATRDGEMAGFIGADVRRGENVAWISTLCVAPEHQRRGIGMELLKACEERLFVASIRLSVRASNDAALRLYARAGYKHFTIWTQYYSDGEDALVLEKIVIQGSRL